MDLLYGAPAASAVLERLKKDPRIREMTLAVVMAGASAPSRVFVEKKREAASSIGMNFRLSSHPADVSARDLLEDVRALGEDPSVTGLVVQLPLPSHLPVQEVLDTIPSGKDADLLSSSAFGRFAAGRSPILPPTVAGMDALLRSIPFKARGKSALVIGAGRLVGMPAALWLMQQKATVTVANSDTPDLERLSQSADLIISGAGSAGLVRGSMVKEGAVVIDAGTSGEEGVAGGDVRTDETADTKGYLAPVPGGLGPLTVAFLLSNVAVLGSSRAS